jgi:dihydroorotate dehydrogenase (fumarate)
MQEAGADALELNIYSLPTEPGRTGAQVEQDYCNLVRQVRQRVRIPLAVKLSQFFSSPVNVAYRLTESGAAALVLFNRFYQPDFDIDSLEVVPQLSLSHPYELLLRLHWVAIIYGQVKADLAITGGVHSGADVLKSMMAGARVAMMTSALMQNGLGHVRQVLDEITHWMEEHEYVSIQQMQGSMSQRSIADPTAFERGNYMRVLSSYTLRPAHQAATD